MAARQADASLNYPGLTESPLIMIPKPMHSTHRLHSCSAFLLVCLCLSFSIHSVELINLRPSTKSAESQGREAGKGELSVVY